MKRKDAEGEDDGLRALLREARPSPVLPPQFQANVWRRIERATPTRRADVNWLDTLLGYLWQPRLAFAMAAVILVLGAGLGWNQGERLARQEAQARYLAAVAPNTLR